MNRVPGKVLRHAALWLLAGLALAGSPAFATEPPRWFADGRPGPEAWQAVELLSRAGDDGLDPRDYDADALRRALDAAAAAPVAGAAQQAEVDAWLSAAMQRFLADLHSGRIDPRQIHENFAESFPGPFDAAAWLRAALDEHRLPDAVRRAAPPLPLYQRLRGVLAQYRELAAHPAWREPLPPVPGRKLEPGKPWDGLPLLVERLGALGDLPPGTPLPERYEGAVVEGVIAFQARHGLAQDGVIGKATRASLDVPPAARQRQIELTLERLRWTPLQRGPRMVAINIPEFVLRAYDIRDGRIAVSATMKVIVGKALNTRTPIFDEDMRFIEFSPYWNVPPSIARKETVPKLRRDPAYFEREGFEFVRRDGRAVTALSAANLGAVLRGELRIRQRPGPKNALGDIKFVFPNNDHIFLHHTPAPRLFGFDRRDFSHGCIRVEDPVALAKFVLRDEPDWNEERIREAMAKGESNTLRLREPVPVVIAYSTVIVKGDGRVFFFPDLYEHDRRLDEALRRRPVPAPLFRPGPAGAQ